MYNRNITPTVEGGLLAAISVILGIMAVYLPILGMAALLLWPLPVAVLTARQGLGKGIMVLFVTAVLMALLIEPMLSARLAVSFGPVGLVLGELIRRGWKSAWIFPATMAVSFLAKGLAVGLVFLIADINVMDMQLSLLRESFDESFAMYETMGVDQRTIDEAKAGVEPALELVSKLMPLVLLILAAMDTTACYFMTCRVLRRIGMDAPSFPPFSEWRLPSVFLYILGFSMVGLYWGGTREITWLYQISLNLDLAAMGAGVVQGISLLWYTAEHYRVSKLLRYVLLFILLTNGILLQILAFTGLFDMLFDYRRRFGGQPRS